jgi:hypothetical protein
LGEFDSASSDPDAHSGAHADTHADAQCDAFAYGIAFSGRLADVCLPDGVTDHGDERRSFIQPGGGWVGRTGSALKADAGSQRRRAVFESCWSR